MKQLKAAAFCVLAPVLVLEILPYGAVLQFATADNTVLTRTFSYFDLTTFGYANFGPFCTAMLTCVLVLFWGVSLLHELSHSARSALSFLSLVTFLFSLMPLLYGTSYFPFPAVCISILLFIHVILTFIHRQTPQDDSDPSGDSAEKEA